MTTANYFAATENSTATKNSAFTDCSFINCPTAAIAAAILSCYFIPAILDQLFRFTITKYSVTEDSSTKYFTTSSTIKSSVFIKCSTIKSSIAECSSTNYSIIITIAAAVIISSLLLFWLLLVRKKNAME